MTTRAMGVRAGWIGLWAALALLACDDGETAAPDMASTADAETVDRDLPEPEPDMGSVEDMGPQPDRGPQPDMGDPCGCPGRQMCVDGDCVEPAMCMGHEDCIAPRACVDGVCEDRCREDTDCPGALRCDLETQECVEAAPCDTDTGCFAGRRCIDGMCVDPCMAPGDCPGAQTCDMASGRCVAPDVCADDEDCPGGGICEAGGCVPPCAESADCPGAQPCMDGRCVELNPCSNAADCHGDRLCVAGDCVDPCGRVGCPGELSCDMASGRCEEADPCFDDAGCRDGRRCVDGGCADPCVDGADCPGALACVDGQCAEAGDCFDDGGCVGDRICEAGACADPCGRAGCPGALACDEATGRCAEADPCREDAQCLGERTCVDGACTEPCRENADCPGNLACGDDGRCGEPDRCLADGDCFGERVCVDLRCVDPCGPGLPCRGTQVCVEGRCAEGEDCADDRDCLADRRCHLEGQVCVDPCVDDVDCFGGQQCSDGLCGERGTCQVDGNCLGDRRCRLGECRTVRCEETAECPEAEVCVDWQCRGSAPGTCECIEGWGCADQRCVAPGPCEGEADCPGACGDDGTCGTCGEDADCPGASGCRDNVCVEPAVCLGPGACLPGRVCGEGDRCVGDPACADDALAGNDIPDAAAALPIMAVTGLVACDGVDDWYRTATDDTLVIVARYASDPVPLELSLYPIFDAFTAIDVDPGSPGQSWVSAGGPGDYLLRVRRPPGGAEVYDLEVVTGAACVDDAFERPWRNDAVPAGVDGRIEGSICPAGDVDLYRYAGAARAAVALGGAVRATVDGQPADIVQPGDVLRVEALDGGTTGYTLDLQPVRDPVGRCEAAEALQPGVAVRAFVQQGPDDFAPDCFPQGAPDVVYRVDLQAPGGLQALFDGFPPMTTMALYDDCGQAPLQCSGGVGALEVDALDPGTYYLALDGPLDGDLTVQAVADFVCADAPAIAPGVPEMVQLAPVDGRFAGGCLAGGPLAIRRLSLAAPSAVTVAADGDAQLALTVRGDCEQAVTEVGCEAGFGPRLDAGVLPAGDHYVIVEGDGMVSLEVTAEPAGQAPTLGDDCAGPVAPLAAPQIVQLEGTTAGRPDTVDAGLCMQAGGGSDQVLRFSVDAPSRLSAELVTDGHLGFLMLLDGQCGGAPVCGTDLNPSLNANIGPGEHALVVDGLGAGEAGGYQLRVVIEAQ